MNFTAGERRIFARREAVAVSAWAARHLIVPDGPYAGARYRRDVNPYLAGIMDCWGERLVEEVLVCGAPQTGKTLCLYACLAFGVDMRPGPRMLAMPDDATLERVVEAKLKPLFKRTRPVAQLLRKVRSGNVAFTDGTLLHLASAASPSQRATISVKDLFLDEEALFRQLAGQGVPVTDFRERTRSYPHNHKIMRISKPIGGEECSIVSDLALMDEVRHYHVVCPGCGVVQVMEEEHVVVEHQVKDAARVEREGLGRYRCPHCRLRWTDYMRDEAVRRGQWLATEHVPHARRVGFVLPAILSSAVSLSEIAAHALRLEKTDDSDQHQAYANGVWARAYKPVVVATREDKVLQLVDQDLPPRVLPRGYIAVTSFVDMQKRGFWYMSCAWTGKLDCAVLDYGQVAEWEDVYRLIYHTAYTAEDGGDDAVIWRAGIDTGGTRSETDSDMVTRGEECYSFVSRHGGNTLFAVKGNAHQQLNPVQWSVRERMPKSRTPIAGGLRLYLLDTFFFKSWAAGRLHPEARQALRLHRECGKDLALQLTAEELVRDRGRRVWRQKRKDNHLFDCLCGNLALVHQSWTPSLASLARNLTAEEDMPPMGAIVTEPALPPAAPVPSHALTFGQIAAGRQAAPKWGGQGTVQGRPRLW